MILQLLKFIEDMIEVYGEDYTLGNLRDYLNNKYFK